MTEKTAAELDPIMKNKLSHRGQALQQLKHKLTIKYE
jgi:XTP/dITP diphosphohydrolase